MENKINQTREKITDFLRKSIKYYTNLCVEKPNLYCYILPSRKSEKVSIR